MKSIDQFVQFFSSRHQKSKKEWETVYEHLKNVSLSAPDNKSVIKEFKKATVNLIRLNHQQYYEELAIFAGYASYNHLVGDKAQFYSLFTSAALVQRIKSGISTLDASLNGGFKPGSLTMFGAPSNQGKTHFLINLGANFIRQGLKVFHVVLESTADYYLIRYVSNLENISTSYLFKNNINIDKNVAKYQDQLIFKNETKNLRINIDDILKLVRDTHLDFKFDVLLIDYTQLIAGTDSTQPTGYEVQEKFAMLTQELNCITISPFQLFSSFNDEVLADSNILASRLGSVMGSIFNTSDNVFVFKPREDYRTIDLYINKVDKQVRLDRMSLHWEADLSYFCDDRQSGE